MSQLQEIQSRALKAKAYAAQQALRLGDLQPGDVVTHPYWKLGKVVMHTEPGITWVTWYSESNTVNPQTGRPSSVGKLHPMSPAERVWAWRIEA